MPRPKRAEMATAELRGEIPTGGRLAFAEVPHGGLTLTCCDDDAGGCETKLDELGRNSYAKFKRRQYTQVAGATIPVKSEKSSGRIH